jgi:hypothetical protein
VKLKGEFVSPIKSTTEARGLERLSKPRSLYSGQSALSEIEKRHEAATMAVALAQPHRGNVYDTSGKLIASADDKRLGTALGRFCAYHRPKPLADWLYDAGDEYGRIIYEFRKAVGAPTINQSTDPLAVAPLDANGQPVTESARSELAQRRWCAARDVLDVVDRQAAIKLEYVCHDDRDPPAEWSGVLVRGLLALAKLLKLAPPKFHEERA